MHKRQSRMNCFLVGMHSGRRPVEPHTASTLTFITTAEIGHDASPAVAEESVLHVVSGANYMEAPTTCSTPSLTEHVMAESAQCRPLYLVSARYIAGRGQGGDCHKATTQGLDDVHLCQAIRR